VALPYVAKVASSVREAAAFLARIRDGFSQSYSRSPVSTWLKSSIA
jgi:hypothetical protein